MRDARLIAAAPDLYAALDQVQEWLDDLGPVLGESQNAHRQRMMRANVRAALEKADGR